MGEEADIGVTEEAEVEAEGGGAAEGAVGGERVGGVVEAGGADGGVGVDAALSKAVDEAEGGGGEAV